MKFKISVVVCILVAFTFIGCTTNKNSDYKVTLVPQAYNSVPESGDMKKAAGVITRRLNNFFNIPEKSIITEIGDDKISLTIHNIDTGRVSLVNKVISGYGRLEFFETYENSEIIDLLSKANDILREMQSVNADVVTNDVSLKENPLLGILSPMITDQGKPAPSCLVGLANGKDTSLVNRYLKTDQVKALFPADLKFIWGANPYKYDQSRSLYELHAIKTVAGSRQAALDGSVITSAGTITGPSGTDVRIRLSMDSEGAAAWAVITRNNINRCIAVVFDGYVRSYPRVMNEITGGGTEISGNFTVSEANDFVNMLNSGQLPFKLKITRAEVVKGD